jgi:hypothetical protein
MKQWLFVVAFGAALNAGGVAHARPCADRAPDISCDHPVHLAQTHHPRHRWHWHEHPVILAAPPADDPGRYVPYEQFYPPMPASIFDLPPDRDFLNYLR